MGIRQAESTWHSAGSHCSIQTPHQSSGWTCLCGSTHGHVWPPTIRHPCQQSPQREAGAIRIQAEPIGPWIMDAQLALFTTHFSGQPFCRQVCRQAACGAFGSLAQKRRLQDHLRWTGTKYIGITLDWDYEHCQVHLSMPEYKEKGLTQFQHERPTKWQDSPHPHTLPKFGAKVQYAKAEDTSAPLDTKGPKLIQKVNSKYLYLGRAVDGTLLVPLSALALQQAKPTDETMARATQLLNYIASQEDAILTYHVSNMILAAHSNLNKANTRSRVEGAHILIHWRALPANQ